MANSLYTPLLKGTPDADFANTVGAVLQSSNPVTYYRVKAVIDGEVLEISRLARRPKQLKYTPAFIRPPDLHETVFAARPVKPQDEPESGETPTKRTKSEPLSDERLDGLRTHINRSVTRMDFGPARKGEKTAAIIILLTLGLTPDQVVQTMQYSGWPLFRSKATIMQRRRGLRIGGWEMDFCGKHGIVVDLEKIL